MLDIYIAPRLLAGISPFRGLGCQAVTKSQRN